MDKIDFGKLVFAESAEDAENAQLISQPKLNAIIREAQRLTAQSILEAMTMDEWLALPEAVVTALCEAGGHFWQGR